MASNNDTTETVQGQNFTALTVVAASTSVVQVKASVSVVKGER